MSDATSSTVVGRARKSVWPAITVQEAFDIVERILDDALAHMQRVKTIETRELRLGDVLYKNLHSKRPHPPFPASIKDGYAVIASDGAGRRAVIGASYAQKGENSITIQSKQCCRINTGAPLPNGADAVVQIEDTNLIEHDNDEELFIEILKAPNVGQDIRKVGSDVSNGELLLEAGQRLQAAEMAVLALNNERHIDVFEPASVCVLSTGDELVDSFYCTQQANTTSHASSTAIFDTNRPMLLSLFCSNNFRIHDLGIVEDSREKLRSTIESSLKKNDVLVVSGGVSMGEKDYLKAILAEDLNFEIHFGRVFMKPGLPTTFASGKIDGHPKLVFGLPGNPVSAFVTSQLFVVPVLKRISGSKHYKTTRITVQCSHDIALDSRPEFRRACFKSNSANGRIEITNNAAPLVECIPGSQISSRILSARSANLLLELPPRSAELERLFAGQLITALVIGPL